MIKEFRVENFLSWVELPFQPRDINLVIGLNNSGKTNLCNALLFLSCTSHRELQKCLDEMLLPVQGMANFSYKKPTTEFLLTATLPFEGEQITYKYELALAVLRSSMPDAKLEVQMERLTATGEGFEDVILLENTPDGVRLLHEGEFEKRLADPYKMTSAPRDTTMLHRLYDRETNRRANHFKQYLSRWQYYSFSQNALRQLDHTPNTFILNPDGSNLASVIWNLKKSDEGSYRTLLRALQLLEPDLDFINFFGGEAEPMVTMWLTYKNGARIPAWRASAGTLRFLALSYVFFVRPPEGYQPLLIVEEPENGLYVGILKKLLDMLGSEPSSPQVLFTSHSPYFIDLFDDKLQNIFVTTRDEYRSLLRPIDTAKAKARLSEYPLGEQHYREMLV